MIQAHNGNTAGYSTIIFIKTSRPSHVIVISGKKIEHLVSVGKGENSPVANNNSKEGRYQNRRAASRSVGTTFSKAEKSQ